MKAIIYENYGPPEVLTLVNAEKPEPKENEILVKVRATTVTAGTQFVRAGRHPDSKFFTIMMRLIFGMNRPKRQILGYEFAGEIEKVGKDVSLFKIGDKVFGTTTGLRQGAYAEYVCVPESWKLGVVTIMPSQTTFEEATAIPIGGMTALHILKKGNILKGQRVLIYGASGSVGTYAVQLAKYWQAEVTGVCSTSSLDLVRSIGADKVIDYTKEDFSKADQQFDVIFDAVGKISKATCKNILKKKGTYLSVKSITSEKTESLIFLKELIESKKIRPVIDKIYPLEETAQAHAYADLGHKKGNVVISI
ncbi:NAD(P)-dependent alcohol dehydrogenase [Leptospira perolatii]|uniref:NAD(P)-dependent alcohol dehydrogenase n=1 Tax=Leptospira perolatii TaxID=2023191 RepID=A0A2M9ZIY8_9LEPT|nr:NAD(P)-dependent alcohol dehydrogenase [Leptospira perolatii]PJZ68634.1 NAD(P)-dependent alcohol dehydrogenase [Leptospira perolatii]PJZ71981.1 NAD(P)-dependent alcohol dehydrogenase [Leptospira perolatii]